MKKLIAKIRAILRNRRVRKIWTRTVSSIACLVVFITTYALVLPAITMESEALCGIEAHQHDETCYEERLICNLPESEGHIHTEDCYSTRQKLICNLPEHLHDSDCYDENGNLACSQQEHQHGKKCFEEIRELICGLEEAEGHHHDSSCYETVLVCGKEAHTHSQACYREDAASVAATERAAEAATAPASENGGTAADGYGAGESSNGSSSAFETLDPAATDTEGFVSAPDESDLQKPQNSNTAISNQSPADDETTDSGNSDAGKTSNDSSSAEENIAEAIEETHPAVSFEDSLTVYTGSLSSDLTGTSGSDAAGSHGTDTAAGSLPDSSELTVSVSAEAGTFPAGTTMVLSAVTDMDSVAEAVEETVNSTTRGFQAVDISFRDKDGNEIEPLKPISVTMRSDSIKAATEDSSMAPLVVHVEDQNQETAGTIGTPAANVIETLPDAVENKETSEAPDAANSPDTISFQADDFSVYAIVYTVDFEYEVDGKVYQFSIPGGSSITLSSLLSALNVTNSSMEDAEADIIALMDNVDKVEFSAPELVSVKKYDKDTSVDGTEVKAGDWLLTSHKAFTSEENLTITLKNGDKFEVKVTDAATTSDSITWKKYYNYNPTISIHYVDENGTEIPTELITEPINQIYDNNEDWIYLPESPYKKEIQGYTFQQVRYGNNSIDYVHLIRVNNGSWWDPSYKYYADFYHKGSDNEADRFEMVQGANADVYFYYQKDSTQPGGGDEPEPSGTPVISARIQYRNLIGKDKADVAEETLEIGADIDLTNNGALYQSIENNEYKYTVVQGHKVTRVTYTEETKWEFVGLVLTPVTHKYVTFYNGDKVVIKDEWFQSHEYVINYVYDDGWTEGGSGTVSGPGTRPLPEPDLGTLEKPTASKTLTPNNLKNPEDLKSGDGTYTLTLSTTIPGLDGQNKNKANIVVVYDSSNSMNEPDEYIKDSAGAYGTLYQLNGPNGDQYDSDNYKGVYDVIQGNQVWDRINRTWITYGNRQRYRRGDINRHTHAKEAVEKLGLDLLDLNTTLGEGTIELALVEYATDIRQTTAKTDDYSTFVGWVEDCGKVYGNVDNNAAGATNWDAALRAADSIDFQDSDPVYIVFLSDGDPTVRVTTQKTDDGTRLLNNGTPFTTPFGQVYGTGSNDTRSYNYNDANNYVTNHIIGKKAIFTVGFGDATALMGSMANNGYYDGTGNDLSSAFNDIVSRITARVGYSDVVVTDGITSMTSSTPVHGNPGDFTYKVTRKNEKGEDVDITADVLAEEQKNARFVPTVDNDKESGKVIWDLGDDILTGGATYSVSFVVWPDQDSYDLVSDLNNGIRKWNQLTEKEKSQVVGSGDGTQAPYSLKTNTSAGVTYYPTKEVTNSNGEKTHTKAIW